MDKFEHSLTARQTTQNCTARALRSLEYVEKNTENDGFGDQLDVIDVTRAKLFSA